jgi:hypothetical protein
MKKAIIILSLFAGVACGDKSNEEINIFPEFTSFERANLQAASSNTGTWDISNKLTITIPKSGMSEALLAPVKEFRSGTNILRYVINMDGLRGVDVAIEFRKNNERVGYGEIPMELGTNTGQKVIDISSTPDVVLIYVLSLPGTRTITIDSIKTIAPD